MEIYNERVNALLKKSGTDLKINEDSGGQAILQCKEEIANSPEHVLSIMKKGNKNRGIEETNMNKRSSRSHSIFKNRTNENRSTKVEEIKSKLQEKNRVNQFLEELIELLKTHANAH
ncbi:hypothetical protein K0M31_001269 [Melipona bicolor]|uniref:Kinesin motor domain-containing protein n=1 Tax=Melipona bicolor TaxID=60889 RepID=A0AA40KXL3_9HYME|nr:hypothetical protein K0M31_001269 [Melipona bicolor]